MARPRTFDEQEVVAAARDEFWERGYAATSVDDLTAATGLGKGSLYGAFGDKHNLYLRALDDYISSSLGDVRASLRNPSLTAYDRLASHIRGQAKVLAADKGRRGCLMAKSAAELGATDDAVEQKVERAYIDLARRTRRLHQGSAARRNRRRQAEPPDAGQHGACVHARPGSPAQGRRQARTVEGRRRRDGLAHPDRIDRAE